MKTAARPRSTADCNWTSLVALYPTRSRGICLPCRLRAAALRSTPPLTYLPSSNRRYASESVRSRIARTIWGPAAKDAPKRLPRLSGDELNAALEKARESAREAKELETDLETDLEEMDKAEGEPWTSLPVDPPADYKPALTAYGLPHTGDFQNLLKDPEKRYKRFMRETKLPSSELTGAVRQALVDISTREETSLALTDSISLGDGRESASIEHAKIFQNKDGKILVQWATSDRSREPTHGKSTSVQPSEQPDMGEEETSDLENAILEPASAVDLERPGGAQLQNSITPSNGDILEPEATFDGLPTSEELQDRALTNQVEINVKNEPAQVHKLSSKDLTPFMRIRLEGNTLFAVIKRVMQLTGIRIPDCAVQNIGTVKQLLAALQEKPKPTKLAQVLAVNDKLKKLPNVQLMATRYTPISKEKETGRWKVIVRELKERDLPVTGILPPSEVEDMLLNERSPPKRERLLRQLSG